MRDQNTNGSLSPRWQPLVRVYNPAVVSTNLMNQISAVHCSGSPSFMAQGLPPLSHRADGNVTRGADGEIFFFLEGWRSTDQQSSLFFLPRHLKEEAETETVFITALIQTVSLQTLSHLRCRPAGRGGAADTKLSSFFLEFVEHHLHFNKRGQLDAAVCWSMQSNWKVCIP